MTTSIAGSVSVTALTPLLLGVGLLVFGTNLQGVLVTIIGHERGSGLLAIGLFPAGWSAGFGVACLCVGHLLSRLGHVRSFTLLAVLSGMSALLLASRCCHRCGRRRQSRSGRCWRPGWRRARFCRRSSR